MSSSTKLIILRKDGNEYLERLRKAKELSDSEVLQAYLDSSIEYFEKSIECISYAINELDS